MVRVTREGPCLVEDCDNPRHARGYCSKHYRRFQKHGDPLVKSKPGKPKGTPQERPYVYSELARPCLDCGEFKVAEDFYKRSRDGRPSSYCKPCQHKRTAEYERRARTPKPPRIKVDKTLPCSFTGCDRTISVASVMLCSGHYQQHLAGKELRPLGPPKKHSKIAGTDKLRVCTNCGEVKDISVFYKRTQGGYQNNCGPCMVLNNSFNTFMRQGRYEDALERAESTPGHLGERNRARVLAVIKETELERSND